MIKNIYFLVGYTLFYHGLYYCPFMEENSKFLLR